jgi:beta-galactosidase
MLVTRRNVIQTLAGAAAAAIAPVRAFGGKTGNGKTPQWPQEASAEPWRVRAFNDNWRFYRGDAEGAEAAAFNDANWRVLDVPHDWSIEDIPGTEVAADAIWTDGTSPIPSGPFDRYASAGQNATGWTVGGIGWYRKTFSKPEALLPGGKTGIRFEGVYMNSDVWLNGVHLGNHPYGYTEFVYDLSPHLKDGDNVIAVRVNNSGHNSRWYSGSGIFRKVWIKTAGDMRIANDGVVITTPELNVENARVEISVNLENDGAENRQATVWARLMDGTKVAGAIRQASMLPAAASKTVTCVLQLGAPHLWSPDDPNLYQADVVIEADGKVTDSATVMTGLRTIEIDAEQGLRINGQGIKLRGGCVHHDNGPLGSASIPRAEQRKVEILKANGYNAIRTSHNPPSRDFLDACDRLGMLVIDEAFDCWEVQKSPDDYHLYFKDWWQRDLGSMILRDRNHPCVVLWSIGNEVSERATYHGVEIGKALQEFVHKLVPTGKVTAAITWPYDHAGQNWQDMQPAFTYLDVGGYNYGHVTRYNNGADEFAGDHVKFPERVMVGTESFPGQAFQYTEAVEKSNWIIGDFVWTAIDYMGEAGTGRTSIRNAASTSRFGRENGGLWYDAYCGDLDLIGNKKSASYFRDVVWRRSAVEMAVQRPVPKGWTESPSDWGWSDELRSWTWPDFDGVPLTVRVYTRGDKVTLLLNGKEVGSKELTPAGALKAEFTVPYGPGELKAVAYQGGQEIGNIVFSTVGQAQKLVLTADRPRMKASRDDLSYVMVKVVDDKGHLVPDAVVPVLFSLKGVGELAAVGNGNPKDLSSFRQQRRDTFHGVCLAVVRPTGQAGTIEVQAVSESLESAAITLNAE